MLVDQQFQKYFHASEKSRNMQIDDLLHDRKVLDLDDSTLSLNQEESEEFEAGETSPAGRKKRVLKKAPDAPKRFKSAYILYVMKKMDEIKKSLDPEVKVRIS